MVIKTKEAGKLNDREKQKLSRLEKRIDTALQKIEGRSAYVEISDTVATSRLVPEIKRIYGEAGWKVSLEDDRQAGFYLRFGYKKS